MTGVADLDGIKSPKEKDSFRPQVIAGFDLVRYYGLRLILQGFNLEAENE